MKKILLVLTVCFSFATIYAQPLSYSNYHVVFQDDFKCYANPLGTFPTSDFSTNNTSPYYTAFHNTWSTCIPGISNTLYSPANVTMPSYGVIKITEDSLGAYSTADCNGTTPITVDHTTGALLSNQSFAYGIIEASIQISNDNNPHGISNYTPASSAFWMGPLPFRGQETEIDIIDASEDNYIIQRLLDWYAPGLTSGISFSENNIDNNLSSTFHLYSCVWSPTSVRYYLDGSFLHEIDYTQVRNYPGFYPISIDLGVKSVTTGGFSMYIDSVKVWRQNCNSGNLNVSNICTVSGIFPFISTVSQINPGLYKYSTITSSNTTVGYDGGNINNPRDPIIFEADATIINPNFIADESTLQHSTVTLSSDNGFASSPTIEVTQISNGYFEILPADCSIDNSGTQPPPDCSGNNNQSWYRTQDSNNDSSLDAANISPDPTKIQVYPNPARDNITITYPCNSNSQLTISIKDVTGRVMYSRNVMCSEGGGEQTVDISTFVAGVYLVDLAVDGQHVVKKIVKL